jgi:hypothetical protein
MPDRNHELSELGEIVLGDLQSADDGARAAFRQEFGRELSTFAESTTTALNLWSQFQDTLEEDDDRRLTVAAIMLTVISQNISSYKLFMYDYTVASGSLFRQVIEGVSLAFLCSAKSLTVLDRFIDNKYSTKNAVAELAKHAQKVHVNSGAM